MSRQPTPFPIATIGIDIGKNTFHLVGLDQRGAIVLQLKTSREQLERRLANLPRCLIGMEACSGVHHIGRQLEALGHDVRLIPAQYVKPFLKGHKNDYRDAEAIAEAVQRPTMHFVTIKTPEQMDLLALHRVRSRLVSLRTGVINQIRGFLIEPGITVRQQAAALRKALPDILSSGPSALSPRIVRLIADLREDWRRLDDRIATVSAEIEALVEEDGHCRRLMTVPGIGPIISSAVVAAIGDGAGFSRAAILAPGWVWCLGRSRRAIARSLARSPSAATSTCERCSSKLPRHPHPPAESSNARSMAVDRAGFEAASSQHVGDRARQQARPHRLGGARSWSRISADDHARSVTPFLPRSARWNEGMEERSARRSQETGCHHGPMRSFS
jgi:transposase